MATSREIRAALTCGRAGCPCRSERGNVHCPAHAPNLDDRHPNLTVHGTSAPDGVLVHCKSGCEQAAVIGALRERGLWAANNGADGGRRHIPPASRGSPTGTLVDQYVYRDGNGRPRWEKGRFERGAGETRDKSFAWRPLGSSDWRAGIQGARLEEMQLWGGDEEALPDILARRPDDEVWLCEGEQATRACLTAGLLACCGPWGSSQRVFGRAFHALRGRRVRVWPDNDAPGAEYAAASRAELRRVGADVVPVFVDAPLGGDAADYFAAGGTVEGLSEETPSQWIVRQTAEDAFTAFGPTGEAPARIAFEELVATRGWRGPTLDARLTVRLEPPGLPHSDVWTGRASLTSLSGRANVARELAAFYGKAHEWERAVVHVFSRVEQDWRTLDRSIDQADIPAPGPVRWLLPALIVDGAHTLWFAPGESMKTMLAIGAAVSLSYGMPFLEHAGPRAPVRVLYVNYETNEEVWNRRVERVLAGLGALAEHGRILYWSPRGETFAAQRHALRAAVRRHNVRLVVVDSAQWAVDGKTDESDAAMAYFNAGATLGCAVLTLAHVTQETITEDRVPKKPSGVMTWRDAPRLVHYVRRDEEEARRWPQAAPVAFLPVKGNEGSRAARTTAIVHFDDADGFTGPIQFEAGGEAASYRGIAAALPLLDQIAQLLFESDAADGWSVAEIAEELSAKRNTVDKTIRRNLDRFEAVEGGGRGRLVRYRLVAQPELFEER